MPSLLNIAGEKYGRLTVLERAANRDKTHTAWKCRCDCGNEVEVRTFYLRSGKTKSCGCYQKEQARANRTKHGRKGRPEYTRETHLMLKYGLPIESYNKMLKDQDNKCAICGYKFGQQKGDTYVDHCHSSKEVRGLLCRACNAGIGQLKDSIDLLQSAIRYLATTKTAR